MICSMSTCTLLLCALLICVTNIHCAKILGIFTFPSPSHAMLGSALLKELANRGHQVTMISSFPLKKPHKNYEDVVLTESTKFREENMKSFKSPNATFASRVQDMLKARYLLEEHIFGDPNLKEFRAKKLKYDAAIVMAVGWESLLGIVHELGAIPIGFCVAGTNPVLNYHTGNPNPHSYAPLLFLPYDDNMSFYQRFVNTLVNLVFEFFTYIYIFPIQKEIYMAKFPDGPPLEELIESMPIVLLNSHFSIETPRPYLPHLIQIGGFHLQEREHLTDDLMRYFDSVKKGVIFFSLGTNLSSEDFNEDKLVIFLETFKSLDYDILWKFDKVIPDLPPNVKIVDWLPQKAVLLHPKTLAFITHSGLGGTIEAVYAGVPMLCLPFFADQTKNAAYTVKNGFGLELDINTISKKSFVEAIKEILDNSTYRENIQFKSDLLRNQEMNPMDKAVYWVEHTIRHNGSTFLKAKASKLRGYEYYLLDVIGFLILAIFSFIYVCVYITKKSIMYLCKKNNKVKVN